MQFSTNKNQQSLLRNSLASFNYFSMFYHKKSTKKIQSGHKLDLLLTWHTDPAISWFSQNHSILKHSVGINHPCHEPRPITTARWAALGISGQSQPLLLASPSALTSTAVSYYATKKVSLHLCQKPKQKQNPKKKLLLSRFSCFGC